MAQKIPRWLTRRNEAHRLISWLQNLQIRWAAWKDTRRVNKSARAPQKKSG